MDHPAKGLYPAACIIFLAAVLSPIERIADAGGPMKWMPRAEQASAILGIDRKTLYRKLLRYGLENEPK